MAALLVAAGDAQASFPGADGKFVQVWNNEVVPVNPDGSGSFTLPGTSGAGSDSAKWSANGQRITFERFLTSPNQWDLYVANADGTAVTNVTQTPTDDEHSPGVLPGRDEAGLLEAPRRHQGDQHRWHRPGERGLLDTAEPVLPRPEVVSDGTKIAFSGGKLNEEYDIYTVNADGTGLTNVTQNSECT